MKYLILLIAIGAYTQVFAQNYTKEQTIDYINEKLHIADPVFSSFTLGDNGEAVMKWVNSGYYTEYRFNIREIEIAQGVSSKGDNFISFTCIAGVNNCLQRAVREDISAVGDRVDPINNVRSLNLLNIAGFDNVVSVKNALTYLKILSDKDNQSEKSERKDPFLY